MFSSRVKWHEEGEKNNAYFLGLMNSKYTRLNLHKVTDEVSTATDKETIMEKVKGFYQNLYKKRNLCNNYAEFLTNVTKISGAAKAAMEADLTLEELGNTIKSKAMKDTAPGLDGIPPQCLIFFGYVPLLESVYKSIFSG